jgi:hypothetical protein
VKLPHDPVNETWGDVNDRPDAGPNRCKWCGRSTNSTTYECASCRHTDCCCAPVTPEPTLGYVVHDGVRMPYSRSSEYVANLYVKAYPEASLEPVPELVEVK